jgi:hypothetical protein
MQGGNVHKPDEHLLVHFHAWHRPGVVQLDWELRHPAPMRWRVPRSETGFAQGIDSAADSTQTLVFEGEDTHVGDQAVRDGTYYYTVFGRSGDGPWCRVAHAKVRQGSLLHWFAHDSERQQRADQELADGDVVGTNATVRAEAEQLLSVFPGQALSSMHP